MWHNPEITVWVYKERVDMRKSIDGLSIIVASNMAKNPSSGELFLFFNKSSDKIKILYWDRNGFCIWYKRLEKGSFRVHQYESISYEQLRWLLDGLDIRKLEGYKRLGYENFY